MKRRLWSMWGYEISCCQSCGVQFPGPLCHFCEPPKLSLNGGIVGKRNGGRAAQTADRQANPATTGVDMEQGATPVNNLAKRAPR